MEENISDRIVAKFKSIIQRIGTAFRQERTRELFTFLGFVLLSLIFWFMQGLNEEVENQVRLFLSKLEAVPKERLVELASARNEETYKVAYKQAQKDFENAQKQVTALEEEAVKALTGESQLDLSIVNQMLLKHRAKLEASQKAMEEAQARMQAEQENAKATKAQVDELLSWAECLDKADIGTKHLIVSRLIERVEVRTGYKMHIKFKISLKQFLGQE